MRFTVPRDLSPLSEDEIALLEDGDFGTTLNKMWGRIRQDRANKARIIAKAREFNPAGGDPYRRVGRRAVP